MKQAIVSKTVSVKGISHTIEQGEFFNESDLTEAFPSFFIEAAGVAISDTTLNEVVQPVVENIIIETKEDVLLDDSSIIEAVVEVKPEIVKEEKAKIAKK